ncbi:MAG: 2-oxoglutarate dehydrogenase E1 component [Opitutae bacterium]|nr:2-oxoglutarate dehydrogenase E1 component [Opitutae bacterium]|tara:strand:+ start:2639 stop:5389 length:2751 start_codon:yes stop_codon:yes gene_type:complete
MDNPKFATRWNLDQIESNYDKWLLSPSSVDSNWQYFFEGFHLGNNGDTMLSKPSRESNESPEDSIEKHARLYGAIYAFRDIGHTQGRFDPLRSEIEENPRLSMERLGFNSSDMDEIHFTGNYLGGMRISIGEIFDRLKTTYCGNVGVEYLHIQATDKRRWIQSKIEPTLNQPSFSHDEKLRILRKIVQAEEFENFLHTRYVGQKRFSLEGGETLITALDSIFQKCPDEGVEEIVMGMAHRGRLNVLANVMGKSHEFIFREFSENFVPDGAHGSGDVKYHLGYESIRTTSSGQQVVIHLSPNPSHLEAVNGVVEGKARARQRLRGDSERKRVLPILVHGDASMAGQGVVAEVFNFSKLAGYRTGGTVHVVVNNQIGFTTDPTEARSSLYCTDVAKAIEAPIFHVNGNDPLAVAMVAELALAYRQKFSEDVVIDINCYRKHGHNEADDPAFTQPLLYQKIKAMPSISSILSDRLVKDGELKQEESDEIHQRLRRHLDASLEKVRTVKKSSTFEGSMAVHQIPYDFSKVDTAVPKKELEKVMRALSTWPNDFNLNPKIKRQVENKAKSFKAGHGIEWGLAEQLAFGSLMLEGTPVRLSGQDSERGTFSHRHAAWYDFKDRTRYVPLLNMEDRQGQFCVYNSLLSEAAVLAFDYGYSLDYPSMLSIWEAQFGDFANGAQVIIDQFIMSAEDKWGAVSDLVMLLPHGFEGQGPEHSSARLERFLQGCAEDNAVVANLTTPAQYFHALRRQKKKEYAKPLVIMSPKSLLRHKSCVSELKDFTNSSFEEFLLDPAPPKKVETLVLCSGKIYYDLIETRESYRSPKASIMRIEQFYPFNREKFTSLILPFEKTKRIVWCQEEPKNMGAWSFLSPLLEESFGRRIEFIGRTATASPATGSLTLHKREQAEIITQALGQSNSPTKR